MKNTSFFTVGIDLGDRELAMCALDPLGEPGGEATVSHADFLAELRVVRQRMSL